MRRSILSLVVLFLALSSSRTLAASAPRITYDRQCISIDGQDVFIFSGAFHYFRCPKQLWRERFQCIKDAGLNTVETYVAWNWHEPSPPSDLDDFSKIDMTDLSDWLKLAADEFGLNVILRPGPYICAEWDAGGFPQWLITKRPEKITTKVWYRGDDPAFVAWEKHWYTAVAKVAAPYQITHRPAGKPGIILWQLENEYDYAGQPPEVRRHHLRLLGDMSRELGIDVPLLTCQTTAARYRQDPFIRDNVVESRNFYPSWDMKQVRDGLDNLRQYQPDKYLSITECQGGWFSNVGGKLSQDMGLDAAQINQLTLQAIEKGVTSLNYYMFFGGTNLGDRAAQGITTTYDYAAPLREPGGVGGRWQAVAAIGRMLQEHGARLARSEPVELNIQGERPANVSMTLRRANDGCGYLFVRNESKTETRKGKVTIRAKDDDAQSIPVEYDLGPFGAKVLFIPQKQAAMLPRWLPDVDAVQMPKRPDASALPKPIQITEARRQVDAGPAADQWKPIAPGQTLEDLGVFDSRFMFYRAALLEASAESVLAATMPKDDALVVRAGAATLKPLAKSSRGSASYQLDGIGGRDLMILYENTGHPNGGPGMEQRRGISGLRLKPVSSASQKIDNWKMHVVDSAKPGREIAPDFDDSGWPSASVDGDEAQGVPVRSTAVFRATFDAPAEHADMSHLVFGRIDDVGHVYVNSEKIGDANDWSTEQEFALGKAVKPGKNVVAVVVENTDGPGGLARGVSVEPPEATGRDVPISGFAAQSAGSAGDWWKSELDDSSWQTMRLGKSDAPNVQDGPLTWYRLKFSVPATAANVWAPWKIRLDATGNGFLYLNGHALGRWWQVGPQREYFLPSCWLNLGEGKQNVLTLCLRPVDAPVELKSAELSVYAEQAEQR